MLGFDYAFKDWEDGNDYRAKIRFIPDGYTLVTALAKDVMPFKDFAEYYYRYKPVQEGDMPDINDIHKFGWMSLDAAGEVVEIVRRTNPDAK